MAAEFTVGVSRVMREFLKALKSGLPLDLSAVNAIIDTMAQSIRRENRKVVFRQFATTFGPSIDPVQFAAGVTPNNINLSPLQALLEEKNRVSDFIVNQYRFRVSQANSGLLSIGRRGQDIIREISLRTLEKSYIQGSPTELGRKLIRNELKSRGVLSPKFNSIIKGQRNVKRIISSLQRAGLDDSKALAKLNDLRRDAIALTKELGDKIPIFHQSGEARFWLHLSPYQGDFRAYVPENYADLVARTTTVEASNVANVAKAGQLNTRLVKWNFIGKDYKSLKDPCQFIDGGTYSTEQNGTTLNGKFFPFWRLGLTTQYKTPHVNCRHRLRPVSEALAAKLKPGKVAA